MRRVVAWVKDDPFGVEFAEITLAATAHRSTGCRSLYRGHSLPNIETSHGYLTLAAVGH